MLFYVICEYYDGAIEDTAGTRFGIIDIHDEAGTDYTFLVGREDRLKTIDGAHYHIASQMGVDPDEVELEVK